MMQSTPAKRAVGQSSAPADFAVPRAVLFDAYGTLFDVYSVSQLAEELFPGHGQTLSVCWRDKQIEYTRLVTTSNHGAHYRPFWELTRCALTYAIKKIVLQADAEVAEAVLRQRFGAAMDRLLNQYRQLSAFPENRAVLQQLKARGVRTGILSNGDAVMLDAAVASAGFRELLDCVISVDPIRKYKTDPAAYALGEQTMGLSAAQMVFVSSNAWDALAATWYGYQTLWVNRYRLPFEELGTQPTQTGTSLRDIMHFFPN